MQHPTTAAAAFVAPDDYAVVVGIDHYPADIPMLRGCVNDATLFESWLLDPGGGGLDPTHITRICSVNPPNGKPPREDVEDVILHYFRHRMETGRPRGRRLYLYFAGHGVTPKEPYDEDCGLVMANAVLLALRSLPGRFAAKRIGRAALFSEIVLFMDCCRQVNGTVVASCGLPDLSDPTQPATPRYLYGFAAGWAMTASEKMLPHPLDPTQPDLVQGVFTHTLLKGLRTAIDPERQEVTSASLKDFVRRAVQELLPENDNLRPEIQLSDELVCFGRGVRVPVQVRCGIAGVVVHVQDGIDLSEIDHKSTPDATGNFRFNLPPARYVVVAKHAAGAIVAGPRAIQVLGAPLDVQL
jgi:hypothetical protein